MNLVIDIGNTRAKVALFKDDVLHKLFIKEQIDINYISGIISRIGGVRAAIYSSVRSDDPVFYDYLTQSISTAILLSKDTRLPIINTYETPETLGKDRVAAVVGATVLFPGKTCLVIDAGTAITYDIVTAEKVYLGGNISPGLDIRFRALNEYTGKLPRLTATDDYSIIGKSTKGAILSGVQTGMIYEVESYIQSLSEQYGDLITVLTGGDAKFFDKKLKYTIFAEPDLTLVGLNSILNFNVEE